MYWQFHFVWLFFYINLQGVSHAWSIILWSSFFYMALTFKGKKFIDNTWLFQIYQELYLLAFVLWVRTSDVFNRDFVNHKRKELLFYFYWSYLRRYKKRNKEKSYGYLLYESYKTEVIYFFLFLVIIIRFFKIIFSWNMLMLDIEGFKSCF